MTIGIAARASRQFAAACPAEVAFDFLCDVAASARLFPLLADIQRAPSYDRGADLAWRSVLRPQGPPPFSLVPVYVCRYHLEPGARRLSWSPVEGAGNTRVSGRCQVDADGPSARLSFELSMETQLSAPALARRIAQAAVQVGFEGAVSTYVRRVQRHLERGRAAST